MHHRPQQSWRLNKPTHTPGGCRDTGERCTSSGGGDLMFTGTDAKGSERAARHARRRAGFGLTAGGLALLLASTAAPAASAAPLITKVTPTAACPGQTVKFEGTGFLPTQLQVRWEAPNPLKKKKMSLLMVEGRYVSSTEMEALVPLFVQAQGN